MVANLQGKLPWHVHADTEAHVLLIDIAGMPNTGDPATAAARVEI